MRERFLSFANKVHQITGWACVLLLFVLISTEILVVALRSISIGFLSLQDLGHYAFALLVLFAIPYAVRLDRHVRVDILRRRQGLAIQRKVDISAYLFLLFPVFALVLFLVLPDLIYSWVNSERSPQIGGLPFYYLVKTGVPLSCILICVQGAAWLLERRGNDKDISTDKADAD